MDLKKHYQQLFQTHGNSAKAVQWGDHASQTRRFEVLAEIAPVLGSVADVGCGLGHLYAFLSKREPNLRYLGLDFVSDFISEARQEFAASDAEFQVFDLFHDPIPTTYDYLMLSGVFNNEMDDNWGFMTHALTSMFAGARKGIAFNAMSTYVDYRDPGLFYLDPCKVFEFCKKKLSNRVTLRHDYLLRDDGFPFEFAMYVYK